MSIVYMISVAAFGLSLLVIVHEAGHYLAARAFGMRVTRFSIGIGPVLARFQPKGSETVFQVSAIPFMAYVLIGGMNPAEESDPNDPDLFPNKSLFARITTIFAGPFANYLAACLMTFGLATTMGWPDAKPAEPMVVGEVRADTPAAKAGLMAKDVIVEANGTPVRNVTELIEQTKDRAGKATVYVIERPGQGRLTMTLTPNLDPQSGRGIIGVSPVRAYKVLPVGEALQKAVTLPVMLSIANLEGIADMIRRRTTENLKGPIGMGKMIAEQAEQGLFDYIWVLIMISVALGFFNLFPFPGLDGGRLAFLGYEVVTRRRPNERIEQMVHAVGLLFLLGVIVLVTFRDVAG